MCSALPHATYLKLLPSHWLSSPKQLIRSWPVVGAGHASIHGEALTVHMVWDVGGESRSWSSCCDARGWAEVQVGPGVIIHPPFPLLHPFKVHHCTNQNGKKISLYKAWDGK